MRISRPWHRGAGLALGVALIAAGAAPAGAATLSLEEALALAERENPELRAARARADAQRLRGEATGRALWPRLSATSDWTRTDTPARVFASRLNRGEFSAEDFAIDRLNHPDALSHLTTSVSLELPLDVSGRLRARTRGEESSARAAQAEAEEAGQDVRLGVVSAYLRAALARRAISVAARALDGARAREADVQARVEEGTALRADLLRVRARRRMREAEEAAAEAEAQMAVAALARVLGASAGTTYEPVDALPVTPSDERDVQSWTERALAGRSHRRALEARKQSADWSVKGERRQALPELAFYGLLQDDRGGSGGQLSGAVGVGLRWSILDGARGRRVGAASAEARAVTEDARAAEDQIRLEVEAAWRRVRAARTRHEAAQGGAEEGREALRVVQERRQAGMATLTDELETESASLAAELEELRAAIDAARAHAQLRRAAGEL